MKSAPSQFKIISGTNVLKFFRTAKIFMSEISDMIQRLCPDGVEYRKLGEGCSAVLLSLRRIQMKVFIP